MPEGGNTTFRSLAVILLAVAGMCVAVAVYWFAVIHPRRGVLFVALAIAALVGAWFTIRAARQKA